ncbi:hypothetical protein JW979_07390 [bacterium]|nr:hypothetical protein [candidate division CSSED10-310 bacterium]
MPGYLLVEQNKLSPPRSENQGVKANSARIGFFDFIRSLDDETFPYDENSSLMVVGIEEVLLGARPNMEDEAKRIRSKLNRAASQFDRRNCADIQIVFRQPLIRGDKLAVDHVTAKLPIYLIFGSPVPDTINGQTVFRTGSFNLTGAGY